jgi:Cytochrome c554 and c-prime
MEGFVLPKRFQLVSFLMGFLILLLSLPSGSFGQKAVYVGSEKCKDCHEAEHTAFQSGAKKAHSYESIRTMQKKLTPSEFQECFRCHTTGYGQPGGFRSIEETPHLKDLGCEVCHGPGSIHAASGDSADLTEDVTLELCGRCHDSKRVAAFRFKPMLFAGAH